MDDDDWHANKKRWKFPKEVECFPFSYWGIYIKFWKVEIQEQNWWCEWIPRCNQDQYIYIYIFPNFLMLHELWPIQRWIKWPFKHGLNIKWWFISRKVSKDEKLF
jgi:hypothetical protein